MAYRVMLVPAQRMPRKRGRTIYYPGVPINYETWDEIPEPVRQDHELTPGVWWTIEEIDAPPKRREKKPKAEADTEPGTGTD